MCQERRVMMMAEDGVETESEMQVESSLVTMAWWWLL